jgi:hypothetical protein
VRSEHVRSDLTAVREAHVSCGHLTRRDWEAKPMNNEVAGPKIGRSPNGNRRCRLSLHASFFPFLPSQPKRRREYL